MQLHPVRVRTKANWEAAFIDRSLVAQKPRFKSSALFDRGPLQPHFFWLRRPCLAVFRRGVPILRESGVWPLWRTVRRELCVVVCLLISAFEGARPELHQKVLCSDACPSGWAPLILAPGPKTSLNDTLLGMRAGGFTDRWRTCPTSRLRGALC